MIAGQTFENFQDMYQRAVKISRVYDESESENRALNLGKRKMGLHTGGFRGRNYKLYKLSYSQGKGKQPMAGEIDPSVDHMGGTTMDRVPLRTCGAMSVERCATR